MTPADVWLWTHFGLVLAGLAGLLGAVLSAALYLWQSSQLKSKHPGASFMRLPSLDALDRAHVRSLIAGVVLFTFGLLAGLVWAGDLRALGGLWRDPRAILSLITCLLFWAIVSLRLSTLRRGQKIAASTLIVFLLLSLTIASSYVVPGAFHGGA
jgi:ABC-type transport system involved in cytochrome c biogenesis permease subunit